MAEKFIDATNLTYCGKDAQEIFGKEVYSLDLRSYGITLMDNVKGKTKIYTGEVGDVWQEYTCPFTPDGEVVLDESYLEPVAIKVNLEECYDKFWNTYLVEQTSITLDGGIPRSFFEWFFEDKLIPEMDKEYQQIFWNGDTEAGNDSFITVTDGVVKKLATDGHKITATAFTVDNILAQVEALVSQGMGYAAAAGVSDENYKVFMNKYDIRLLEVALGKECSCNLTNSVFANYAKADGHIYVFGFEVVPTELDRNTAVFGPAANLVLGFDTFDSHLEYRILDMKEHTGDNTFRVIAISNIAVGVVNPSLFTYLK